MVLTIFRANLGYDPVTGKQIQKYRSGFKTKKEAREEYSRIILSSKDVGNEKRMLYLLRSLSRKSISLGTKLR